MLRLEIDGADELVADMKKLVTDYPKAASDALFDVAENFNEDVNAKMPANYSKRIDNRGIVAVDRFSHAVYAARVGRTGRRGAATADE